MIKLSAGTAHVLGMKKLKTDAPPTTAYLMAGEGCKKNCSFCAQATGSESNKDDLSRIRWQEFAMEDIVSSLIEARKNNDLKRTCIQVVDNKKVEEDLPEFIEKLTSEVNLPLCISKAVNSLDEIKSLLLSGAAKVTISLDVVNPESYDRIKAGKYEEKYDLLTKAAQAFPGRISTHIIVGLGESEEEVVELLLKMKELKVGVGLFAFTPLPGTKLSNHSRPEIGKYRRIQIANYLIFNHKFTLGDFDFQAGEINRVNIENEDLIGLLDSGDAFKTTGCPDCNRPYYNEKPGGTIYNYPRALTSKEVELAMKQSGLVLADE
jgi:biotin synthase